ncbi:ABC transporter substrate-binding protein [Tsukamurella tyrosinosolvens]|uniref:ABC transporter substrate-binding protein n=1 Tax=Tsukamurella tyrosinosolvens TaxID=57704 RepID=UPI000C7F5773|nr:ABC transporter substrate-binding protein [Tsukamurella tyrosinosolvens]AUN40951.1 ABC transporter substrate-binding protein [Tsukamurella tyrosinosolvens]
MTSTLRAVAVVAATATALASCSLEPAADESTQTLVVGYQSKTINTVTAGTLLRAKGFLEKRLAAVGKFRVDWQDFDTGAPITSGMLAGKIQIGSMGDYPLLINGSRAQSSPETETAMLSVTGSSARGALNSVVVSPGSPLRSLADLRGKQVSASVGSAGHGTLVAALSRAGLSTADVTVVNQQPQVGASALESGQVQALAQFVAWPGLLVHQGKARLLYDGGELNTPTLHGVVANTKYAASHPDVVRAFLEAQLDATDFQREHPLEAAQDVAQASGLPAEVVYQYNGPGGTDPNPTLTAPLIGALKGDIGYLQSIGQFGTPLDVDRFVDPKPLAEAQAARGGFRYDAATPAPRPSAEVWFDGADVTQTAPDATALIRTLATTDRKVRAAYVSDALTGTRWYADQSLWLRDGAALVPFAGPDARDRYRAEHPGAVPVEYRALLEEARR